MRVCVHGCMQAPATEPFGGTAQPLYYHHHVTMLHWVLFLLANNNHGPLVMRGGGGLWLLGAHLGSIPA